MDKSKDLFMKKLAITITAILASSAVYAENEAGVSLIGANSDNIQIVQISPNSRFLTDEGNDANVTMQSTVLNDIDISQEGMFLQSTVYVKDSDRNIIYTEQTGFGLTSANVYVQGGSDANQINVVQADQHPFRDNSATVNINHDSDRNLIDINQSSMADNTATVNVYWGDANDIDILQNEDNLATVTVNGGYKNRVFVDQTSFDSEATVYLGNSSNNNQVYVTQTAWDTATVTGSASNGNYVSITQY